MLQAVLPEYASSRRLRGVEQQRWNRRARRVTCAERVRRAT